MKSYFLGDKKIEMACNPKPKNLDASMALALRFLLPGISDNVNGESFGLQTSFSGC